MKKICVLISLIGLFAVLELHSEDKMRKKYATFAGGCFWCIEQPFDKTEGVIKAVSGYTGGNKENPTYEEVSSGQTGHIEAVRITYDPDKTTYDKLLDIFWRQIDPTDSGGQFADRGPQYRTAIFYHDKSQKEMAEKAKNNIEKKGLFDKPIVTEILPAGKFYKAEEYHQDYHVKHPIKYNYYKSGSGRTSYIKKKWKDIPLDLDRKYKNYIQPDKEELKRRLTPLQYHVTQEDGTERPFNNEYWDNNREGIYVDIVSGEPLYSSKDKFKSGTGWPSFTKPLVAENIVEKKDRSLFMVRTEVRSKHGDSHLGHVFDDGPPPTGMRHCINSASLRFIPKEELEKEGYGEFKKSFK